MTAEFKWEIGTVPPAWELGVGAPRVINGDFKYGPMAAVQPPLLPFGVDVPSTICMYQFHYDQRHKVQAWLRWFLASKED